MRFLRNLRSFLILTSTVLILAPSTVFAALPTDRSAVHNDTVFFDPYFTCDSGNGGSSPITPGPIYIVGDSIMTAVNTKLAGDLTAKGWQPKINALGSRKLNGTPPSPDGLGAVDADASFLSTAKVVVVELGTNVSTDFDKNIPIMINKIRSLAPQAAIFWVDTAVSSRPSYAQNIAGANSAIYGQSAANNYKVIGWYQTVFGGTFDPKTVNASAVDTNKYIRTDDGVNVHPTAAGINAYSNLIVSTIASGVSGTNSGGASPTATTLPTAVPAEYRDLFARAAQKFGTDVALLATIFWKEHGGGFPPITSKWASSSAGAQGPFQFLPSTWAAHGQDGNGDGIKDIQNIEDASYGAAELLASMGGKAGTPAGSLDKPMEPNTIVRVMLAYNWGPGNVENFYKSGRTSFNDISSNEAKDYISKGLPFYLSIVGGLGLGVSGASTCSSGSAGSLGISADGFVFPLITTQAQIQKGNGNGFRWCYDAKKSCHHDYNAADIGVPTNTVVVAAKGGTIVSAKQTSGKYGATVRIKGDDGFWFYYAHMYQGSLKVKLGDHVSAGQPIGVVGLASDGEGTVHLHFDISPRDNGFARPSKIATDTLIDPQPVLIQAYNKLPAQ